MALPEVVATIEQLFLKLDLILVRLGELQTSSVFPWEHVREAMATYNTELIKRLRPEFEELQTNVEMMVAQSPLHAPTLSFPLNAKLAAALRSPNSSTTVCSPRSELLDVEERDEDDSENE